MFAAIWLVFLIDPLSQAWHQRDQAASLFSIVLIVGFAGVYLTLWTRIRQLWGVDPANPKWGQRLGSLGALTAMAAGVIAILGETGLACLAYIAVSAVMLLPARASAPTVAALIGITGGLGAVNGWGSQAGTAFGIASASLAIYGLRAVMRRNAALVAAHRTNESLVVENERSRFARDLHDILGHSLTVITVKAELAQRLLDVDVERARAELADLERLSRDALTDIRRAVEGYRELTLPGELARARTALAAAEIEASVPNSTDEVPGDLRDLFAWTVREGVTNVIRHSGARRCDVVLTHDRAEVQDDGTGPATDDELGSGLRGLRERAGAVGATVVTTRLEPGFSLAVVRRLRRLPAAMRWSPRRWRASRTLRCSTLRCRA